LIRRKAEQIAESIEGLSATILMGDLNTMPDSEPLQVLTSETGEGMKFIDSLAVSLSEPAGPDGTWNGFTDIAPGRRIDFLLIGTPVTEVASHQTLDPKTKGGRFASDHLPVLVGLKSLN
jgi:endonuclease/exonuclease/phosphatase family metal-dependent hydrolase